MDKWKRLQEGYISDLFNGYSESKTSRFQNTVTLTLLYNHN